MPFRLPPKRQLIMKLADVEGQAFSKTAVAPTALSTTDSFAGDIVADPGRKRSILC